MSERETWGAEYWRGDRFGWWGKVTIDYPSVVDEGPGIGLEEINYHFAWTRKGIARKLRRIIARRIKRRGGQLGAERWP